MLHFIVNARSGKGLGNKTLKFLCDYCYKNNLPFTAHITAKPNHATDIAKVLCKNGANTIIAVGGDGTFSEVLGGIIDFEKTALGFIPAGRGNDYARATNLSLKPIKALEMILKGKTAWSDYIEINNKRCLNIAGSGLDVAVLQRADGKSGKITYLTSLLYCLKHFEPFKFNISVDGKEKTYHEVITIAVCNGTDFGGGLKISPLSKLNDGKMNLVILHMPPDGKIMKALIKFKRVKHLEQTYVDHILCDSVVIEPSENNNYSIQLDGEIYKERVLEAKIIKSGMRSFVL
ncbi:MAG: diacylglycerol kinase family lipid kinase [Firmicutes bacterium]|nr:diacylglycerol kinase family lipid kinase [Bacillota bacterium]